MCGTTCVDLRTNPNHCGECRNKCASGSCEAGSCVGACPAGQTVCPPLRKCVDLQDDRLNCGQCSHICPLMQVCRAGACVPRNGGDPLP
jgi:hypothetical protein